MIVVKHVDSIFGSLLPIRLSTFKLVDILYCMQQELLDMILKTITLNFNIIFLNSGFLLDTVLNTAKSL